MNQLDFKGRTAVVTGGLQGIGAAIAKRLEESGATVGVWDLAAKKDPVDVSDAAAVERAAAKALAELGRIDVLVNCVTPAAAKTAIFDQMTKQHIDYMLAKIPMNRFVTVDEIASLVCWLASEDCSFSTGAVFDISGGRATY